MKKWLYCVTLLAMVALFSSIPALAYDNDSRGEAGNGLLKGGPHRTINTLALQQWIKTAQEKEPALKRWGFDYPLMMSGPGVLRGGLELPTYGERMGDFQWWIAEGGYTADEPELFASFRHFFDPKAVSGALFLTDHLDTFDTVYKVLLPATALAPTGISDMNPEINARDWALTGERNKGICENDYSWKKGTEYLKAAFAERDSKKKEALFAQAWRACGETMHLIADMTCVPHVRNDSHPGKAIGWWKIGNTDPNLGYLKNDPYELYTNAEVITENKDGSVDPVAKAAIDSAGDPLALFNNLAAYTQDNFFSAETISGTYIRDKGKPTEKAVTVASANGMTPYPLPKLADCDFDQQSGMFTRMINGKRIIMCAEDWMSALGWGDPEKCGPGITRVCTKNQATILIPIAIYANARLLDWFIPRMDLAISDLDLETKQLRGTFTHVPNIVHTEQLHYLPSDKQYYVLSINYIAQSGVERLFSLSETGELKVDLSEFPLKEKDRIVIGIGVGGIVVRSKEYVIGDVQTPDKPHWVFDRTELHGDERRSSNAVTEWEAIATITDISGTTRYTDRCKNPKYEYISNWNHTWSKPPAFLVAGEKHKVRVGVNPLETRYSGEPFYRNFGASTYFRCMTAAKGGSSASAVASTRCFGGVDEENAERNKPNGSEEIEFDIPNPYQPGLELLLVFSISGNEAIRDITYYYKWSEPEPHSTPVDPNDGCVIAGTLVTMADGTKMPIESVLPGSRILAYDTAAKAPCFANVEKLLVHNNGSFAVSRLLLGSGESLGITANHPIYTRTRGWQTVEALKPGEVIFTRNALTCAVEPTTVTSIIRDCSQAKVVYNLKTSQGNYFANDLLVHNKCLSAGSLVETPGGPRAIEALRVGDVVYGRVDGRRAATAITHVYRKETVLPSLPGKRLAPGLAVTVNHRVWDNGAFRPAGDLSAPGESITGPVYDIQTAAGNYYAGGFLMTAVE